MVHFCEAQGCEVEVWCGPHGEAGQDFCSRRGYDTAGAEAALVWHSHEWNESDDDVVEAQRSHSHRGHLVARLFRALGKRRLEQQALGQFARLCGFRGGDVAWAREYGELCRSEGWDEKGPVLEEFEAFVTKPGKGFCLDEELAQLLAALGVSLPSSVSRAVRDHTVEVLFQELRRKSPSEGRLRERGLGFYAGMCGFQGSTAAWAKEYRALCLRRGFDSQLGLGAAEFQSLVDDTGGPGFSTGEELLAMLVTLRTPRGAVWRP